MGKIAAFVIILVSCLISSALSMTVNGQQKTIDEVLSQANSRMMQSSDNGAYMDWSNGRVVTEIDMMMPMMEYMSLLQNSMGISRNKRKAFRGNRWTNRRIPYVISADFSSSERAVIMSAIADYTKYTCVRFVPKSSESDYVRIYKGDGCKSYVGKKGGEQDLSLGDGCVYKGIVIHELGHALGFYHEQSRPDRDDYVRIHTENIEDTHEHNFNKYSTSQINTYGVYYDYSSIMHYGPKAFTKNGEPTITTKSSYFQNIIGNREGLSFQDIKLANLMYGCAAANQCSAKSCGGRYRFQGPDCNCWCCSGNYVKGVPVIKNC